MPSKNDLSAIKLDLKNSLPDGLTTKTGRKCKAAGEKENKVVVLKLKASEYDALKNQARLVPLGTFVKHHLRQETDLLG